MIAVDVDSVLALQDALVEALEPFLNDIVGCAAEKGAEIRAKVLPVLVTHVPELRLDVRVCIEGERVSVVPVHCSPSGWTREVAFDLPARTVWLVADDGTKSPYGVITGIEVN